LSLGDVVLAVSRLYHILENSASNLFVDLTGSTLSPFFGTTVWAIFGVVARLVVLPVFGVAVHAPAVVNVSFAAALRV
jgi:hypothetical protein